MATYFHGGPEMQPDGGLQTLYLMNPSYGGGYADAAPPPNMVLLNSSINNSVNSINFQQQQQKHFVGVPLEHDSNRAAAAQIPNYNLWAAAPTTSSRNPPIASGQKGLSLSLSPHEMVAPARADEGKVASAAANGVSGLLLGSRYLKAAQQLLDEVVNVGKGIKDESPKAQPATGTDRSNVEPKGAATGDENASTNRGPDLSTAERQELQMKKAKLVNMLEEVEQRYRQYHHQMQVVVSSFDAVAGYGWARTYTALALRTISKQFRCLREAISGQIRAASKSLGEEDAGKASAGSRLRFIDHHLRQQRALQQLGMVQHNAWRPQRGLPERSVSILRAWLFEHFLHPYPKDSDKLMLAKQTGLTRSQVSNWFINARVRLWKPMVEEMYLEEVKEHEQNNNSDDKSDARGSSTTSKSIAAQRDHSPTATADAKQPLAPVQPSSFARQASYYDKDDFVQPSAMKKARGADELTPNEEFLMKLMDGGQRAAEQQGYPSLIADHMSYGGYPIGQLDEQFAPRFSGNMNGVSLTLGLQYNENLSLSGVQPQFLSGEGTDFNAAVAHPSAAAFRTDRGLLLNYYQTS
ncbi:BEL1-like homeodomain protein 1 [Zingiber officinale]|uniref:Homeobox domain-containing protein n=1 Tax=Zingiber officinale TaxID=94328 RepID=A0A8J5F974_ZINOF|nr:BEL1-like homeodomain protein 1 [Zingiber officinale]XP_042433363.1 BEL1-like homeodomain protein 1 [Zingiber officinale]KAG6478594.1 hypothetical protein ZIOFF_062037 [Zingiber officinale]